MDDFENEESSDDEDMYQIPCPAPHPEARYKLTDLQIRIGERILSQPTPIVVHTSTANRRELVRKMVQAIRERFPTFSPINIIYFLLDEEQKLVPTTVLTYINTMTYLFPKVKTFPAWKDHYRALVLRANQYQPFADQANILTLEQMKLFVKEGDQMKAAYYLILLTWLTASRYGDLRHMLWIESAQREVPGHNLTIGIVDMKGSKGDPSGNRGDMKAIVVPKTWTHFIKDACVRNTKRVVSNYLFKKTLKTIDVELTLHSCRRGASQTLARLGFAKKTIQELTLHQQQERKECRSMDIYQNGLWLKDPREINQITMQLHLLHHLGLISNSTMQHVLQAWLPAIHSYAPAIDSTETASPSA